MRRLLVASLSPGRGGAEEYAATIALEAGRAGWKVLLAAPEVAEMRPLLDELAASGTQHVPVAPAATRRSAQISAIGAFIRALVVARPSAALLVLPWPRFAFGQLLACAALNVPTVAVFQLVPEYSDDLRAQLAPRARIYRWARSRRQAWIAVSDHARESIARLFDAPVAEIGRVYNGVEVDRPPAGGDRREARAATGLDESDLVLLSVGRLTAQKAHADLVQAAAAVADRYPRLRVLIAGEGPERAHLEGLAQALGIADRVWLLGHVADPSGLHRLADLFVFPSRFEGFPFAMLEAMAAGLPVIAARFGGADEVIEPGHEGLLVAPGDPEALASAIEEVVADPQRLASMGARARQTARRFSRERMVQETIAVIERQAALG